MLLTGTVSPEQRCVWMHVVSDTLYEVPRDAQMGLVLICKRIHVSYELLTFLVFFKISWYEEFSVFVGRFFVKMQLPLQCLYLRSIQS